ncbi:MAG: bifunctional methylenetetrahydrofolate dehydrogenase/methenyltetrahydrofolate cyclohydrolase FolD [Ruminococcus sp.]|nr:bifunctional methylenetetrahydrofolate dehydrogenase/methenyltetrahydrofolate cyclohydrolase FolD [Ruminococcus sp.]
MANIIDGKAVSAQVKEDIRIETEKLKAQGIEIGLAVVIVGNDPASQVYVRNKEKACEAVGFNSYKYALPEETTEQELLALVDKLNNDDKVDGILVQLPLPKHLDDKMIINNIRPDKDVDAFHPVNVGKIMIGDYSFLPCTPAGVMELIKSTGTQIEGKECVVIGRSNIVGKPQAMLLLHQSGTVTICHSKTKDLKAVASRADILVAAVGKPKIITADYVKEGAIVIDVGMDRDENGKLCGDVDFENVKDKASYITPVPGGVGPMTIAMLMKNTLTAGKEHHGISKQAPEQVPDTKERTAWNKVMLHT